MGKGVLCSAFVPRVLKGQVCLPNGQCAGFQIDQSGFRTGKDNLLDGFIQISY